MPYSWFLRGEVLRSTRILFSLICARRCIEHVSVVMLIIFSVSSLLSLLTGCCDWPSWTSVIIKAPLQSQSEAAQLVKTGYVFIHAFSPEHTVNSSVVNRALYSGMSLSAVN